jgi:hypothetical protein
MGGREYATHSDFSLTSVRKLTSVHDYFAAVTATGAVAFAQNRMLVRSLKHLLCLGGK